MSMHRQIAQMMRAAAGGEPPGPIPAEFVHVWRMIDSDGVTANDAVGNGANLALQSGAVVDIPRDGIRASAGTAALTCSLDDLFYGIRAGGEITHEYSILGSFTMDSYGYSASGIGRAIWASSLSRAIEQWAEEGRMGIRISVSNSGVAYENWTAVPGDKVDIALVTGLDPASYVVYAWVNGVLEVTYSDETASAAASAATILSFLNNAAMDRGWDGVIHWAGMLDYAPTSTQLTAYFAAGRP